MEKEQRWSCWRRSCDLLISEHRVGDEAICKQTYNSRFPSLELKGPPEALNAMQSSKVFFSVFRAGGQLWTTQKQVCREVK